MLILLAIFAFLLIAGSLFPWNFQPGPELARAAWNVVTSGRQSWQATGPRDILVNLVIYVPVGFTGYLWSNWSSRLRRWVFPWLAGFALSFGIETLQHYFPPRAPGLVDVICNTVSTAFGIVLAAVFQSVLESRHIEWRRRYSIHLSSALLLLAIWVSSTGWPVHAFPLGIGMRSRALLRFQPWKPLDSLEGLLSWLLAGFLLAATAGPKAARWWLLPAVPGMFLLQLAAPGHDFTWSHAYGALAAVTIFWLLPERHRHTGPWVAWIWLAWIVLEGLRPFTILTTPHHFHWIPFREMILSSWMPAIGVLLRKTWVYGAAFWLFAHSRMSRSASLGVVLLSLLAVEVAQCWLPGRSPGLTDVAIGLLAAVLLWLVDQRFVQDPRALTAPQTG